MRERILTIGGAGSGKSTAWIRLAQRFKDSTFYVIDTQLSAERSLEEYPSVNNVEVYTAIDWSDYRDAQRKIEAKCKEGDWVVVDMVDMAWSAVQRGFVSEIFGQDMGDYYMEARKVLRAKGDVDKKGKQIKSIFDGETLRGWVDWVVINKQYEDFVFSLVYRIPANLYMTAMANPVSEDDEREVRELYGPYGLKPAGQKALAHQPDTVLLLAHPERDRWTYTTIKDRGGRKYHERAPLMNFALQYGVIAGWK